MEFLNGIIIEFIENSIKPYLRWAIFEPSVMGGHEGPPGPPL